MDEEGVVLSYGDWWRRPGAVDTDDPARLKATGVGVVDIGDVPPEFYGGSLDKRRCDREEGEGEHGRTEGGGGEGDEHGLRKKWPRFYQITELNGCEYRKDPFDLACPAQRKELGWPWLLLKLGRQEQSHLARQRLCAVTYEDSEETEP